MANSNDYESVIQRVFADSYDGDSVAFEFSRADLLTAASELGISVSNIGDVTYAFRSRRELPSAIRATAPEGQEWIIRGAGRGQYRFELSSSAYFDPSPHLSETLIPDGTPALVRLYNQTDEQALLAIVRYNRMIDVFVKLSCFSIQSHLRTTLSNQSQIEIDKLYVGIDRRGAHFILPVEVKSASDKLGYIQIENMFAFCVERYPDLIARPLGAQFIDDDAIAMFEFERISIGVDIVVSQERHFRLAPSDEFDVDLLTEYRHRTDD